MTLKSPRKRISLRCQAVRPFSPRHDRVLSNQGSNRPVSPGRASPGFPLRPPRSTNACISARLCYSQTIWVRPPRTSGTCIPIYRLPAFCMDHPDRLSLLWNTASSMRTNLEKVASRPAPSTVNLVFRRWAAQHGGVYVPSRTPSSQSVPGRQGPGHHDHDRQEVHPRESRWCRGRCSIFCQAVRAPHHQPLVSLST